MITNHSINSYQHLIISRNFLSWITNKLLIDSLQLILFTYVNHFSYNNIDYIAYCNNIDPFTIKSSIVLLIPSRYISAVVILILLRSDFLLHFAKIFDFVHYIFLVVDNQFFDSFEKLFKFFMQKKKISIVILCYKNGIL